MVLDRTPFYAESGGQVGDTGELGERERAVHASPTRRSAAPRSRTSASSTGGLDQDRRQSRGERRCGDAARRSWLNHSATHLLHAALRKVLGTHVTQKGSLVAPDRLRFDFSHFQPITPEELDADRAPGERARSARNAAGRNPRDALRHGRGRRRHGAVRREVRERRARAAHGRVLDGAVRRHACRARGRHRHVQDRERGRRGRGRAPHRGHHRPKARSTTSSTPISSSRKSRAWCAGRATT